MTLPDSSFDPKPSVAAAILILARDLLTRRAGDWPRTVSEIVAVTGSSRSQAYAMRARLTAACDSLDDPPASPRPAAPPDALLETACRVRDFLLDHPGSVTGTGARRRYTDAFRRCVLDLTAPGGAAQDLTLDDLARATGVPADTLKDWRRSPGAAPLPGPAAPPADAAERTSDPQIGTILAEWRTWQGDFTTFCRHLREHHRLPFGATFVASVLQAAGLRTPRRRKDTRIDSGRDTFRRLFPGAQWLGDGTALAIEVNGRRFAFNGEVLADVASNAVTAIHVSDAEDEAALLAAFEHGTTTTGEPPLSITLDNRPSNLTDAVHEAVAPTVVLPATPARGQAKAAVEGAFGLFSQTAPPLRVAGHTERALARSILALVLTLWAWTRNGKPRKRLGGLSPAEHYQAARPTEEDRDAARQWIAELRRRAERARATRERRTDPVRRTLLVEGLATLGIEDPKGHTAADLARYSMDAILRGLATYRAKQEAGTVPADADPARYLAGIVRNLNDRTEIERTAHHLLALRLRHRELSLAPLEADAERLRAEVSTQDLPMRLTERALDAAAMLDFRFYKRAAHQALARLAPDSAKSLFPYLARRIAACFAIDRRRRDDLAAALASAVALAA